MAPVPASLVAAANAPIACFSGGVCLADVQLPSDPVRAGASVRITYHWVVRSEPGKDWKVFLHGTTAPGQPHRFGDDRDPGAPAYPIARWRAGDLVKEVRTLKLPKGLPSDRYELWGGFFQGDERMRVTKGLDDGQRRARFGLLQVAGVDVPIPRAEVHRRRGELRIDGKLDEDDWSRASPMGPFWRYDGQGRGRYRTTARMLWDDEALYLAFDAPDADVHTPYSKRDDPIYESEAVEIFIDADGDADEYVELQVAPNGVQFDARFRGGSRQNMDRAWDHDTRVAVMVDGTINDGKDKDKGWRSEWRIPFAGLPDAQAPKTGQSWKINLFRLDRLRRDDAVVATDATAWSAPLSGDFHRLERFGVITFVP